MLLVAACGGGGAEPAGDTYGAPSVALGQSQDLLGWHVTLSNLRFDADHVLVDVDAAAAGDQRAKPEDLRFGLYGALAHPIEANGIGGCSGVTSLNLSPLAASAPDKLGGTICLGPFKDQSQVRGIYAYSPHDRMPGTTVAYPAAFPVGMMPTNENDTGLVVQTTSVDGFSADGAQLAQTALGVPDAFTGNGYMLLGLDVSGLASRYRDDSAKRGGPLMVVAAPTLPGPGLSYACAAYGASVLILPDASQQAVSVRASLCTQGEINQALLYASVSVIGTHAALWTTR
jgi:hypothetical protein